MNNKLNMVLLVGLITLMLPLRAESNVTHYGKKTAKVVWHLAETGCGTIGGLMLLSGFHKGLTTGVIFQDKNGNSASALVTAGILSVLSIASASLIGHGISGLNKEFEIVDRIKRLRNKKAATVIAE